MSRALMIDPIIGLACGVTHFGLDFRLSEIRFLPQLFLIKPPKVSTKWHCRLNESTSFNSQGMILNGFQKINSIDTQALQTSPNDIWYGLSHMWVRITSATKFRWNRCSSWQCLEHSWSTQSSALPVAWPIYTTPCQSTFANHPSKR